MASVSVSKLNKRQRSNLVNKNKKWKTEGLIPDDKNLYHHCKRCEEFLLSYKFKSITEFSLHGSKSDGCSTYCTNCTDTRLNKEDTELALNLMLHNGICAEEGVVMLRDYNNNWVKATEFENPSLTLASNLSDDSKTHINVGRWVRIKQWLTTLFNI